MAFKEPMRLGKPIKADPLEECRRLLPNPNNEATSAITPSPFNDLRECLRDDCRLPNPSNPATSDIIPSPLRECLRLD